MANKRQKPEAIVQKLRQVDALVGQGMQRVDAIREVRITEQTYYRWRKQYGRDRSARLSAWINQACGRRVAREAEGAVQRTAALRLSSAAPACCSAARAGR